MVHDADTHCCSTSCETIPQRECSEGYLLTIKRMKHAFVSTRHLQLQTILDNLTMRDWLLVESYCRMRMYSDHSLHHTK